MTEDDFVEFLAKEARSSVSALHQFRLSYSEGKKQLHVFLEGDDDALFYLPHVRQRLKGRELFTYFCGGKWGVVDARELVEADHAADCLFFIDRDFDDFFGIQATPHERTYITDTYSIENILVCDEALEVTLVDLAKMSKSDPAYQAYTDAWSEEHSQFVTAIKPIIAWVLAMRGVSKKPNLNNVDLKKVILKKGGRWRRQKDGFAEFAKATCRVEEALPALAIRSWIGKLKRGEEKLWVRGKYELWFFESYLLSCLTIGGVKDKRWSIPSALRERRLFDVLGPRVPPPASLNEFLDGRLGSTA